jgi:hypothetical protein
MGVGSTRPDMGQVPQEPQRGPVKEPSFYERHFAGRATALWIRFTSWITFKGDHGVAAEYIHLNNNNTISKAVKEGCKSHLTQKQRALINRMLGSTESIHHAPMSPPPVYRDPGESEHFRMARERASEPSPMILNERLEKVINDLNADNSVDFKKLQPNELFAIYFHPSLKDKELDGVGKQIWYAFRQNPGTQLEMFLRVGGVDQTRKEWLKIDIKNYLEHDAVQFSQKGLPPNIDKLNVNYKKEILKHLDPQSDVARQLKKNIESH